MKNNIFYIFFLFFLFSFLNLSAQELEIKSSKAQYDQKNKVTIFEGGVTTFDKKGNSLFTEYAKYNELTELIETTGYTKIITSGGYEFTGSNVFFDNKKKLIYSDYQTQVLDKDGNKIEVNMFNYSISTNIFFSKGNIKMSDVNNNNYNFSEIYIDENKKKIIGSDVKGFLNQKDLVVNNNSDPRFFANTMILTKEENTLQKGVFTYCKNRENDKCPPWSLQSKRIKHDLAKKTIYYDNVLLKIYDFPIFFFPKFSHPDPTVKRKSGLLAPSFTNSNTLGTGFGVPYFWNLGNDRDLTISPKLYLNENPLVLAEYRQDFKNSFLVVDAGYTQGYKKTDSKKTEGGRAHFFTKFTTKLIDEKNKTSNLKITSEKVSNDTYLKVYDVDTLLVEKSQSVLENSIDYSYQNKDFFLTFSPTMYEDTRKSGHLRNEYLLPMTVEKNIIPGGKYGFLDFTSDAKIRNFETNKQTNMLVNDFNWKSNKWLSKIGLENSFEGLIKTVNYEAENTDVYKNKSDNAELSSAIGYFAKLGLYKNDSVNKNFHSLTPKLLLRYAPGHMRNIDGGRLNYNNLFNLNKINEIDVIESGLSTSLGFEYEKSNLDENNNISNKIFSLSAGQVVSESENMDIPSSTSLDQRFSDLVGKAEYNVKDGISLNYSFSIDQNYKNFNYNEVGANFTSEKVKFNLNYLQEKNHIGNQEFVETGANYMVNNNNELGFSLKRNILTSSAEFYNLSYNYINDCLKAGIAYRREFYTDRDVEPTNQLMFTISIIPFGGVSSPSLSK